MSGSADVLLASAIAIAILMFAMWLFSLAIKNASIVDIVWGLGFVLVAWVTHSVADGNGARGWLLTLLTTAWGLRLASYLGLLLPFFSINVLKAAWFRADHLARSKLAVAATFVAALAVNGNAAMAKPAALCPKK